MKPRIYIPVLIVLAGAGAYWLLGGGSGDDVAYRTEAVTRGGIEKVVRATGTINPLQTVKVGSQVSGTVAKLFVDFNSTVTRGQIVAVIDSTFLSASVREAEANLQRSSAQLSEAQRALNRTKELFSKDLVSQADLDASLTTYETSVAQMRQTEAALERARVNLRYAVIRSPIDGIVISRDVDVGQTVAASLQAPQLFAIANDLSRMQVEASVDEADIGQIEAGQRTTFTVDAYPDENFEGTVTQVRLSPLTVQNVVTYTVIIEVPNPAGKLRPGMTATASILIDRRDDVLRVPAVALRFQPPADVLEAYNEALPDSERSDRGGRVARGGSDGARAESMSDTSRQAGRRDREGRRAARDSAQAGWRRGGAGDSGRFAGAGAGGQDAGRWAGRNGAGMRRASFAVVWVMDESEHLRRVRIRTGISDQRFVELLGGELNEGDRVVLGLNSNDRAASGQRSTSPFQQQMGGQGGRRGP